MVEKSFICPREWIHLRMGRELEQDKSGFVAQAGRARPVGALAPTMGGKLRKALGEKGLGCIHLVGEEQVGYGLGSRAFVLHVVSSM